jgi:hypothetical protein
MHGPAGRYVSPQRRFPFWASVRELLEAVVGEHTPTISVRPQLTSSQTLVKQALAADTLS